MTDLELFEDIVRGNQYLILATADADGVPWSTPVWFSFADLWQFVWVSNPGARHSQNIAVRPEVAFSIFDSTQPPGTGRGVYVRAVAEQVPDPETEAALAIFNGRMDSLPPWSREDVAPGARRRLYRATAVEHFVLSDKDERVPVEPAR